MTHRGLARALWIGAAAILVAAALIALVAVLRGSFSDNDGRMLITLAALLYTGAAALSGLALVDGDTARPLGWGVTLAAPVALTLIVWAVWSFALDGGSETQGKVAWSAAIALAAGMIGTTGRLLAANRTLARLALGAGAVCGVAAVLAIVGITTETGDGAFVKLIASAWILGVLGFFLVPVLQRFTTAGAPEIYARVLGTLDGVEVLAVRGSPTGAVPVTGRTGPGEHLALRRQSGAGITST